MANISKRKVPVSKGDIKTAVLKANDRYKRENEILKSKIRKREAELKSLDKEMKTSDSNIKSFNTKFVTIEAEFDAQKGLLSTERGRVSQLEKKAYSIGQRISPLEDEERGLIDNVKILNKQADSLKSNIDGLKEEESRLNDSLVEIDFINKQKELLENELEKNRITISDSEREISRISGSISGLRIRHERDDKAMSKKSKELSEELMAISKSVESAKINHKSTCERLSIEQEDKKLDIEAMKSLIEDKEVEFISMQDKLRATEQSVEDEEFRISKIKENFKNWKISSLESVAKLKLKGKLDSIDKAGLKEILNG